VWLRNSFSPTESAELELPRAFSGATVDFLAFARNAPSIVVGSRTSYLVAVANIENRKTRFAVRTDTGNIVLSANGRYVATSSNSDSSPIQVWDTEHGEEDVRLREPKQTKYQSAFDANGEKLALAYRGGVDVWDLRTGQVLQKLDHQLGAVPIPAVAFSSDGKRIVSGSEGRFGSRGYIHVWDIESGVEIAQFKAARNSVRLVRFNVGGDRIIAWSTNSSVEALTRRFDGTVELFRIFNDSNKLINYAHEVLPRESKSE
jgi:WD40 repeat protein